MSPRVVGRNLDPQADFLLDYFFALAAALVALWLVDREPWLLATASVFMGAALLTKREGLLLVACILVAALVGSMPPWRHAWPRLALAGAVAVALAIPWRIWFTSATSRASCPRPEFSRSSRSRDVDGRPSSPPISAVFDYDLWLLAVPSSVSPWCSRSSRAGACCPCTR